MPKIVNRAYMTTATTGTGTITLGSAVASFRSFAASGVVDGDVVRYVIEDGDNWEIGSGTYAASGTTLTRAVEDSSTGGAAINLSGTAVVFVTAVAADFGGGDSLGTVTGADLDLSTGNFFEVTAADQTLTFSNPPAVHGFTIKLTGAGEIVGYDLPNAFYDGVSFSIVGQETAPQGVAFNNTGTKMYIVGQANDAVYQYSLISAYDLSTASYDSVSFSVAALDNTPQGIIFNGDGSKMYVAGSGQGGHVLQYSLSTPYDISTATYDSFKLAVGSQEPLPKGIAFGQSGNRFYMVGKFGTNNSHQYALTTPYDLRTATFVATFASSALANDGTEILLNTSGTKLFIANEGNRVIYEWDLGTAWDITTAAYNSVSFSVTAQDAPLGATFSAAGDKLFVVGAGTDTVYQYTTGDSTTASLSYPASVTFESGSPPAAPASGAVKTVDLYTVNGGTNYYDKG